MKHLYKILTLFLLSALAVPAVGYAQSDTIIVRNITDTTVCDSYEWHGTEYTVSGEYEYSATVDDTTYVDSLYLTINHPVHTALTDTACETYTWTRVDATTQTYTESGDYTYSHEDANGCTQVDTLHLTINPTDSAEFTESACGSYVWNGIPYTETGDYVQTFTNTNGCDSIVTLHLTINQPTTFTEVIDTCESFTWIDGITYTASTNEPTFTIEDGNANDCDSIVTLHLTIHHGTHNTYSASACESYSWHGTTYTTSGACTYEYTNADGCPSVDTLHLTINNPVHTAIYVTECESYTWTGGTGDTYTASGTYLNPHQDANGCTQVDTLHLIIYSPSTENLEATICASELPYHYVNGDIDTTFDIGTATLSTFNFQLLTSNDCDSIVTLHLTINNPVHTAQTVTACETYTWTAGDGETYTANGDYTYSHEDVNGCTQVDTLHLTINHPTTGIDEQVACESYTWIDGNTYTASTNTPTVTLTNAVGCDSIVTLHLTVNHPAHKDTVVTACESFTWHGAAYTTSGIYTYAHQDEHYCWQVDTLHLTILPAYNTPIEETICQNQLPFRYINGQIDTTFELGTPSRQTVFFVLPASNEIDSVIALTLIVNPTPTPIIVGDTVLCQGQSTTLTVYGTDSYLWSNNATGSSISVGEGGLYEVTATSTENCIATASVTVTVNPLPSVVIGGDTAFCDGSNTTLTASGASTYIWNTTETTADIEVTRAGTYIVTGTDINGCSKSASQEIVMNVLPTIVISGENSFCEGESGDLTASGASTYIWNTTEGTPSITVNAAGTYSVTGTDANGCSNTASFEVAVNALPTVVISGENSFCAGESTVLTVSGATTYIWNTTEGTSSITVNAAGTYSVTGTDVNGCANTATTEVSVNALPTVVISGENSFCAGESTVLTASGASTYIWNTAESADGITVNHSGTYSVVGTDSSGCTNTASVEVTENPIYSIYIETSICANVLPYHYENGDIDTTFEIGTPSFSVFNFQFSTSHGCDSTVTLALTIYPAPVPFVTGNMQFCSGEGTSLTAIGGVGYEWSTGETTDQIYVFEGNVYSVTVTDEYGCIASTEVVAEEIPSELEQKNVVSKNHADGTPYMLVYPQADLQYQWFKNGEQLAGETRQYYTPSSGLESNILYTVHVRPQTPGGCGIYADWSWDGTKSGKVSIVPNPNDGHFTLLLPLPAVSVAVYSASGEEVFRENMSVADRVDISAGLSAGLYLLKIIQEDGTIITEKLVINK